MLTETLAALVLPLSFQNAVLPPATTLTSGPWKCTAASYASAQNKAKPGPQTTESLSFEAFGEFLRDSSGAFWTPSVEHRGWVRYKNAKVVFGDKTTQYSWRSFETIRMVQNQLVIESSVHIQDLMVAPIGAAAVFHASSVLQEGEWWIAKVSACGQSSAPVLTFEVPATKLANVGTNKTLQVEPNPASEALQVRFKELKPATHVQWGDQPQYQCATQYTAPGAVRPFIFKTLITLRWWDEDRLEWVVDGKTQATYLRKSGEVGLALRRTYKKGELLSDGISMRDTIRASEDGKLVVIEQSAPLDDTKRALQVLEPLASETSLPRSLFFPEERVISYTFCERKKL